MGWQEFVGYLGSFLLFSTFWMRTMIPLRIAAIAGNLAMATYAAMAGFYPMVGLQLLALPVNVARLVQMRRLTRRVALASGGEFTAGALVPFMQREIHDDGDVLFRAGDESGCMYLIREGKVRLVEVDRVLGPDEIFGEIGVISARNRRTATAVCEGRTVLMKLDQDHVLQLYFQEPEFGFYLMRLVTDRLLHNLEEARASA
jgi:CRP/FNR family transcriptional regulator, cyclic AMP receptor protein